MANRHYEHAIKGLPCRVSSTAHAIYELICYRYDERPVLANGKPNKGYLKSYPGMAEIMSATGRARNACNTAIESLITNNLIVRITIGKPGSRAEFRPIYTLEALGESVPETRHVSKAYKPRQPVDNVTLPSEKSIVDEPNVLRSWDTISSTSNNKYVKSKSDYVNYERWHVISQELPPLLVRQWRHTKESEECLDKILQRTTLKAFRGTLRTLNFNVAHDLTGLYMSHLRQCAGAQPLLKSTPINNKSQNDDVLDDLLNQLGGIDVYSLLRDIDQA